MRNWQILAFVSMLLLLATVGAAAELTGRVSFRDRPLEGAVVTANLIGDNRPAAVSVTQTGPHGHYILRRLRDGNYVLLVDLNGRRIYQGRIVVEGATLVKDIELK